MACSCTFTVHITTWTLICFFHIFYIFSYPMKLFYTFNYFQTLRMVFTWPNSTDHHTSTSSTNWAWRHCDRRIECRRLGLFWAIHFGEVATDLTEYIQIHPYSSSTRRHPWEELFHFNSYTVEKPLYCFITTCRSCGRLKVPLLLWRPVTATRNNCGYIRFDASVEPSTEEAITLQVASK